MNRSFITLFIAAINLIYAQTDRVRIERVPLDEGVSHNMVFSIMQDSKGFMWFGTMFGLTKYDGNKYTVYRHDPKNESSLSNDDIVSMIEDSKGSLWAGSFGGGLNKFNRGSETFTRFDINFFRLQKEWNGRIWALAEDNENNLWIGTEGAGAIKLNTATNEFSVFTSNPDDSTCLTNEFVNDIFIDNDNNIWLCTEKGGLNLYLKDSNCFEHYNLKDSLSLSGRVIVTKIYEIEPNELWLCTNKGLFKFLKKTKQFSSFYNSELSRLNSIPLNSILQAEDGKIWFGSGFGLFVYDPKIDLLNHFFNQPNNENSISGNNVIAICEDNSGIIWIGNFLGGIDKIYVNKDKFEIIRGTPNNPNSILSNNQVFDFMEDNDGYVWVATRLGLNRLDTDLRTSIKFFHNPANPNSISNNNVNCLGLDNDGSYWIGTLNGLDMIDNRIQKITHHVYDPENVKSISSNRINEIFFDSDGDLWVCTDNGLNKFNPANQSWTRILPVKDSNSIADLYVVTMYEDSKKNLWIGTYKGLNHYNKKTKRFIHFKQDPANANSLSNNYVFVIHESKDGSLWIGTGGGLNKYNPETNEFMLYNKSDGLPNDVICGILEDKDGFLYISTHGGFSRFDPFTEKFINFDAVDGLQSNMFYQGAFLKRKNGDMLFGGINGFNVFNSDNLKNNPHKPPVYLTSIKIFDEELKLNKDLTELDEIEFSYHDNFIKFEFAALDYINPAKNQYQYMLEGINSDWINNGTNNVASYTNLPPGNYKFKVRASNSDRVWTDTPLEVAIIINPPYYQTWWFFLIILGISSAVLFSLHKLRVDREITKALEIKQAREQENLKVRRKAADDFHDELGSRLTKISLYSEIIKRNKFEPTLTNINYINKISEISKTLAFGMRDFIWTLDPEKDTLYEVIIRLKDFGDEIFDKTGIAFRVNGVGKELEEIRLSMDWRRHLTLIFKEAMNNILKYAGCKNVTLFVHSNNGEIKLSIEDDGNGFDIANIKSGRGLKNMHNRAKSINGEISVKSGKDKGTVVEFTGSYQ
ncbi:MAG: two-component regulator propeller domain-containing protein [Ignavibacteria bacterium]